MNSCGAGRAADPQLWGRGVGAWASHVGRRRRHTLHTKPCPACPHSWWQPARSGVPRQSFPRGRSRAGRPPPHPRGRRRAAPPTRSNCRNPSGALSTAALLPGKATDNAAMPASACARCCPPRAANCWPGRSATQGGLAGRGWPSGPRRAAGEGPQGQPHPQGPERQHHQTHLASPWGRPPRCLPPQVPPVP